MASNKEAIKEKAKVTTEQVGKIIKEVVPVEFTKEQLLKSKKYVGRCDALNALLKSYETYTTSQVDTILEKFYKGGKK